MTTIPPASRATGSKTASTAPPLADLKLELHEHPNGGAFVLLDGNLPLGRMHYRRESPKLVTLDHTSVDDALRGQGAGRRMLDAFVAWARETQTLLNVTCPYAKAQFEKDPSIRDVLANPGSLPAQS
jgi:predicted GNAT family acetyltransferase